MKDGWDGGAMHVLVLAWAALVFSHLLTLSISWEAPGVGIVAGLLTYPAALLPGYAVVHAGRLTGWRRWTLLVEGVCRRWSSSFHCWSWNWGPSWVTEAGWQLCWVLVGPAAHNGNGGADPAGSGLRGLRNRVEALGGTVEVASDVLRGGVRLVARVPTEKVAQP